MDLTGEETQKAFDIVLTNLARTAPPIPGFRRMKGGLFVWLLIWLFDMFLEVHNV